MVVSWALKRRWLASRQLLCCVDARQLEASREQSGGGRRALACGPQPRPPCLACASDGGCPGAESGRSGAGGAILTRSAAARRRAIVAPHLDGILPTLSRAHALKPGDLRLEGIANRPHIALRGPKEHGSRLATLVEPGGSASPCATRRASQPARGPEGSQGTNPSGRSVWRHSLSPRPWRLHAAARALRLWRSDSLRHCLASSTALHSQLCPQAACAGRLAADVWWQCGLREAVGKDAGASVTLACGSARRQRWRRFPGHNTARLEAISSASRRSSLRGGSSGARAGASQCL